MTRHDQSRQAMPALLPRTSSAGPADLTEMTVTSRALLDVARVLSHDLRAPVNRINGFCRMLADECASELSPAGHGYLQRACDAAGTLDSMIAALVEWIRLPYQELALEECDLSLMTRQIVQGLQSTEPDRHCELRLATGIRVNGDPRLLRLALEQLLANAWKFTGQNAEGVIEFGEVAGAAVRTFFVRDNGAGFDMRFAHRLFTPFQRLHCIDEFPGLGAGLAMVRRVAECHGGEVWAEGVEGVGATFYFTLP
jgi:light-regulated signal transduction histidine kinase (bacteriophytochrome)